MVQKRPGDRNHLRGALIRPDRLKENPELSNPHRKSAPSWEELQISIYYNSLRQ